MSDLSGRCFAFSPKPADAEEPALLLRAVSRGWWSEGEGRGRSRVAAFLHSSSWFSPLICGSVGLVSGCRKDTDHEHELEKSELTLNESVKIV